MCCGPKKQKEKEKGAAPPVPAKCPPPKRVSEKSKRTRAEKVENPNILSCDPMVVFYPYGEKAVSAKFEIQNVTQDRYVFKLKSSNENMFTCKPSCGFMEEKSTATLYGTFTGGPVPNKKEEHYYEVHCVKAKDTEKDTEKYWDQIKEGENVIKRIKICFLRELGSPFGKELELRVTEIVKGKQSGKDDEKEKGEQEREDASGTSTTISCAEEPTLGRDSDSEINLTANTETDVNETE